MKKSLWVSFALAPFAKIRFVNCLLPTVMLMISISLPTLGQDAEEVIKFDISLVTVNVVVKDHKGRALLGLKSEDFLVTDENTRVSPELFESEGPASIVFVVDTSSSMRGDKWKSLNEGLKSFLKKSRVGNDYTLVAFDRSAYVVAESISAEELLKSLSTLRVGGETALYDGVMLGLQSLRRTRQQNRALVLISDGEDNSSHTKLADVEEQAFARRATIYSIGVLLDHYCSIRIAGACNCKETVKQLATITGGMAFFPDADGLARALKQISNEVNSQYSLSYYPPNKTTGWRNVQVAVAQPDSHAKLRYQQRYLMK
jgi:VWFA-related protein